MNTRLRLLLLAHVIIGVVYAFATPLFEASDELWHYPMVKRLADGQGLTVQDPANVGPWRQEGSQPPLYYGLMAAATFWIDTGDVDRVRVLNPHTDNGIVTPDGNNNIVVHAPGETWIFTGTVLAVRVIRVLSVLLGTVTVLATYRLAELAWPKRADVALGAAALAGFTPMFLFISASVNNDTLAVALSSLTLWLLADWVRRPPEGWGRRHILLGVLLGLGALSKQSALGLGGLALGVLVATPWAHGRGWLGGLTPRRLVGLGAQAAGVAALAVAVAGWWYWRNWQLYGDWMGWNQFLAIVGARPAPATLLQLWGERVGFVAAYWGLFGGVSVAMPDGVYAVLNTLVGLATLGLLAGAVQALRARRITREALLVWGMQLAWIVALLVGLVRWSSQTWASQGRLIFPAIASLGLLFAAGWTVVTDALAPVVGVRARSLLFGLFPAGLALLAVVVPFVVIAPHYAPPPPLTSVERDALTEPLADLGPLRLLSGRVLAEQVGPGDAIAVELAWEALAQPDRDWSVFVHLTGSDGLILAQRDLYPGGGALATHMLTPGRTWRDRIVLVVPRGVTSPEPAHVVVGLYDLASGARALTPSGGDSATLASPVRILPDTTVADSTAVPYAIHAVWGGSIELVGYALETRTVRAGETLQPTLIWRAVSKPARNYAVSVRVRGADFTRWAAWDQWPLAGQAPTGAWEPGSVIADPYMLMLDPATPPGQYRLEVVLYDAETQAVLHLWNAEGYPSDLASLTLTPIRVVP